MDNEAQGLVERLQCYEKYSNQSREPKSKRLLIQERREAADTIDRLRERETFLESILNSSQELNTTCPMCDGKPMPVGSHCIANCRSGKVLTTTAFTLKNVRMWIDMRDQELTRLRAERDAALRDRASIVGWLRGQHDKRLAKNGQTSAGGPDYNLGRATSYAHAADAIEAFADREDG